MNDAPTTKREQKRASVLAAASIEALGHGVAIALIMAMSVFVVMPKGVIELFAGAITDAQMQAYILKDVAVLVALSTVGWAVIFWGFTRIRDGIRRRQTLIIQKAVGTVITETLIVLPVFLLLTFGLAQMGVNSMAGLLTTVGTFQAARTAAVWAPEQGMSRTEAGIVVDEDTVRDRARIAAAAVIAPVAPMSAGAIACGPSGALNDMMQGMVAAGLSPAAAPERIGTFTEALSEARFSQRGPTKLLAAYCSTEVEISGDIRTGASSTSQGQFSTRVTYRHKMVFPLVGAAFGGTLTPGGWEGEIVRSYEVHHHLTPNPELPKKNDIL